MCAKNADVFLYSPLPEHFRNTSSGANYTVFVRNMHHVIKLNGRNYYKLLVILNFTALLFSKCYNVVKIVKYKNNHDYVIEKN